MPTTPTPIILTDAGFLFAAPLGTALPVNTVTAEKFSDAWAAAWVPLGATEEGSQFSYSITVEAISVAEFFDPIKYSTTARAGSFAFNLASWTAKNVQTVMNGGSLVQTGTTPNFLNTYNPPAPGAEVRRMIGFESLDNTVRVVAYQCINGAEITSAFNKAPAKAVLPANFQMEKPAATEPFTIFTAGIARA